MHFESFNTAEEMMASMQAAEAAANENVTDQQRAITHGSCWARPMGAAYDYIWVFGRVQTVVEFVTSELFSVTEFADKRRYHDHLAQAGVLLLEAGVDAELKHALAGNGHLVPVLARMAPKATAMLGEEAWAEFTAAAHMSRDSYMRGYRFGKAWSLMEPRGEYGSTHVSEMVPLRRSEFDDAEAVGWEFPRLAWPASPNRKDWAVDMVIRGGAHLPHRDIS